MDKQRYSDSQSDGIHLFTQELWVLPAGTTMKQKTQQDEDEMLQPAAYRKFSMRITQALPDESGWTISDSLVYIIQEYRRKFKLDFVLSYKGSPSSSPEYKLCKRMWMMLGAGKDQGGLVKKYIDWFFAGYSSRKRFTSIGAFANAGKIAGFKDHVRKMETPSRSTPLPQEYMDAVRRFEETVYIKTYGDLAFLKQSMMESDDHPEAFRMMFRELKRLGFKPSMLDSIK